MNNSDTSRSVEQLVDQTLDFPGKEFGGGFKTVGELASPEKYLYWQFPDWKFGNKTVMIPPAYMPSELGYTISRDGKYVHEDDSNVRGMQGEKLVYDRLQHVGRTKNTGMFVIHGFQLKDISRWNERCESIEGVVPKIPDRTGKSDFIRTGESDFIIFHHTKGVILIEVKNLKESDNNIQESSNLPKEPFKKDEEIDKAKDELNISTEVVKAFAKTNSSYSEQSDDLELFPIVKFIALPSTRKGTKHTDVEETSFIFEEDLRTPENFSKWWTDNIETLKLMPNTLEITKAYELALSRMLAVRHLGPVTESEYTANTSYILGSFKHLDNQAKRFRRIREIEYPHLFRWCKDMSQLEFRVLKEEAFDSLRSVSIIAAEANLTKVLNKHLSDSKFINGEKPAAVDTKVFKYLSQEYIMDIGCIVRCMNRVTEARKKIEHPHLFRWCKDMSQLEPAKKVLKDKAFDSLRSVNIIAAEANLTKVLNKHLSDSKFINGEEPADRDTNMKVFQYLSQEYIMDFDCIVRFMNRVTEARKKIEHPHLFRWCKDMSQLELPARKVLKEEAFDSLRSVNIIAAETNLTKVLNKHLSDSKFINGEDPAAVDTKVFQYLSQEYIMDFDCIVRFMNRVTEARKKPVTFTAGRTLKDFIPEGTEDIDRLNKLSKLLDRTQGGFLGGEHCTYLDVELCDKLAKGDIRVLPLAGKTPWAPVFTMEQLAVFEGPRKQLIIGGPGSGKTELMKAKALTLSQQTKDGKRILYLIQLPDKKSVFPNVMAKFFQDNKAKNVDVATIQLDGERHEVFECVRLVKIQQERGGDKHEIIAGSQSSQLLEMYSHVFIDELWIGSKIRHEMKQDGTIKKVDELEIAKQAIESIEGYVWMSSVFDFKEECFEKISDKEIRYVLESKRLEGKGNLLYKSLGTPSLLETLRRNGGVTCRIKHLLRSTNNNVKLLQDYSSRYLERDFPYGTENMLNHNVEGQEISWIVAEPQSLVASSEAVHKLERDELWQVQKHELAMQTYSKCAEVIKKVLCFHADLRPPLLMKTSKSQVKLQLCPGDILVVNFIARYQSKLSLGNVLERNEIPFYDFCEQRVFSARCLDRSHSGVFLLNSLSRDDSTCVDGAEWPMVIILLTPELMLSEASVRFETVRNYDPYIAMFRAQAKLVVISDTWTSSQEFLDSVDRKSR